MQHLQMLPTETETKSPSEQRRKKYKVIKTISICNKDIFICWISIHVVTRNPCHWKLHFNIYSPCSAEGDCQEVRRLGSAIIYMSYINKHKILVDMQISFFLDICIIRCNDCFVFKLQSNLSIKTFPNTTLFKL